MGVGMTGWGQDTRDGGGNDGMGAGHDTIGAGHDTMGAGHDTMGAGHTTRWETGMEAAARKMNGAAMGRTSPNSRPAQLCNSPPTITPEALFVIPATPPRHSPVPHVIPA